MLAQVGQMWHDGEITVSHEHRATEIVKSVLARWLAEERTGDRRAVRAIVACAPEELHEVGALTLALLLVNRGFDAEYFGQSVPIEDLRSFVRASKGEAV